jgi:hypothetical protein
MADDSLAKVLAGLGLGAGGFLAATVLNKVAEKSGESLVGLIKKVTTAGLLSLIRLLRGDRMLERYRRAIPAEYGSHVLTQKRTIGIRELYVDLQYVKAGSRHDLLSYVSGQRAVLILGEAGAGKSLLLKTFLLRWAADPGREPKIPVLVELHRCNAENPDFVQLVADRFKRSGDRGGAKAREFVEDRLAKGELRILFDGLDELSTERQDAVASALQEFRRTYAGTDDENSMVVTCRGSAYTGQLGDAFTKVEIAEFDDAAVLRFLGKWLASERSPDSGRTEEEIASFGTAEQIFEQIRQNPLLINLARNPLLLSLIADLYTVKVAGKGGTLPAFRSELYGQITGHLISRDPLMARPGPQSPFDADEKLAVLKRVALVMTETSPAEGDRLVIASTQLDEAIKDALIDRNLTFEAGRRLLREIVERSQLLTRSENGERYWFAHRSFQEYFTARALEQRRHIGRLLDGYWSDPVFWRDTVRFWCGLKDVDCTDVVAEIFRTDDEDDTGDRPERPVLTLECLTDAREIDGVLAQEIITHFMDRLSNAHDDPELEGIVAAFGTVAAGSGLRSEDVYRRLRTRAERGEWPSMAALARSRRESAAKLLTRRATHGDTYARGCLREMGEAAVPALAAIADDGALWAVDTLGEIGTPAAAVQLVGLIWRKESNAVYRAAWWLAALLARASVELALREWDSGYEGNPRIHNYAWTPFLHGDDSDIGLRELAGRISFLLDPRERDERARDQAFAQLPAALPHIDPRIGIQLATFNLVEEWGAMTEPSEYALRDLFRRLADATRSSDTVLLSRAQPRRRHGDGQQGSQDEADRMLYEIFVARGISSYTRTLVALLPFQLKITLVQETVWPIELRPRRIRDADVSAWCRSARDTEHRTTAHAAIGGVALAVLVLAALGLGGFRSVVMLTGQWPWGPYWLGLVLPGLLIAAAIAFVVGIRSERLMDLADIALIGLVVAMVIALPALALITAAAWLGWIVSLALAGALAILAFVPLAIAERLDHQTANPFRRIMVAHPELLAGGRQG